MAGLQDKAKLARLEAEKKRLAALQEKKRIAEEQKYYDDLKVSERYAELMKKFKQPTLIDLVDLNDLFRDITVKDDEVNEYEALSEEKRKEVYKEVEENIRINPPFNGNISHPIPLKKMKEDVADGLDKLNAIVQKYFHKQTPIYNGYVCSCCGAIKPVEDYNKSWLPLFSAKLDDKGFYRVPWCIDCAQKLFDYFYLDVTEHDEVKAMQMWCCATNTYFDLETFKESKLDRFEKEMKYHIVLEYLKKLSIEKRIGFSFWNNYIEITDGKSTEQNHENCNKCEYKKIAKKNGKKVVSENEMEIYDIPLDWEAEDAQKKIKIIKMLGYDPFDYEIDDAKKILYNDFLNIIDLDMATDFNKTQAAIQIVSSFYRIRMLDKEIAKKNRLKNGDNVTPSVIATANKDLKDLIDLKTKELKSITDFSRDNGFSERYAKAKAKGDNTLSGVMNKMKEAQYEDALLNAYDIKTSNSIKLIAETSIHAIMEQLSLGEGDLYKVTQDQLKELKTLRSELDKTKEDLRLANIKNARVRLKVLAMQNGEEVDWDEEE